MFAALNIILATFVSLVLIFIFGVTYGALICFLRRRCLAKQLPGMKIGFLDFWADAKNFTMNLPLPSGNLPGVSVLQTYSAYSHLFRDKCFFNFWFSFCPIIFIIKAETVEELIGGTKNMEKNWTYDWFRDWLNDGLLLSNGQKWKSRRKLLTPSFHFDILKDFLPKINEKSQILIENFRKETQKDWTDVTLPITLCTLDIICETTLGVSVNAQENSESEYVQAIGRVSSIILEKTRNPIYFIDWIFKLSKLGRQFRKDVKLLHNFTRSVILQKKGKLLSGTKSPGESKRKALLDTLLEHHLETSKLTEEDIREEVDTFTFEGHDTTAAGIYWALYLIGLHKDVQDKIHEELDGIFGDDDEQPVTQADLKDMLYLDRVLKECQRLFPSVPLFGRKSSAGTVLNGYEIPEGSTCFVLTYMLHRDPDVFPNPEKFDPDRFLPENSLNRHPYAYIPFSAGPRNCIGQRFAVIEEKTIIANILRNFTLESLEARDKVIPSLEVILRNSQPVKIRIRYRNT